MTSRYITNIVLLLVIAGLVWFKQQPNEVENKYPTITTLNKDTISSITITQADRLSIKLQKNENNWHIISPFNALANKTRIQLLLSLVDMPSYAQQPVTPSIDLNQFGLNTHSPNLELNDLNFQFGDIESLSKNRYVLFNNTIHLIPDQIFPLLRSSANSFIENKLIANKLKLTKLSLPMLGKNLNDSEKRCVIKLKNGHWESNDSSMTTDQLTQLIANWKNLYASQVILSKPDKLQHHTGQIINLWFDDKIEPKEFELKITDKLFSLKEHKTNLNYHFPISQLTQLLPTK